jgi:hypothetical protein
MDWLTGALLQAPMMGKYEGVEESSLSLNGSKVRLCRMSDDKRNQLVCMSIAVVCVDHHSSSLITLNCHGHFTGSQLSTV